MLRLVRASFRAASLGDFLSVAGNTMEGEEVDLLVVVGSMLETAANEQWNIPSILLY
jgi:hypothetical protein